MLALQLQVSGTLLETTVHYQLVSKAHELSHPSPSTRLPSSQASEPNRNPSPQLLVKAQISNGNKGLLPEKAGSSVQVQPASNVQVEEHPSPLAVFPSSHASPEILRPSPQAIVQTLGGLVLTQE